MNESKPKSYMSSWSYDDYFLHPNPSSGQNYLKWSDTRSGSDNIRYKQQIRDGTNASTDFVGSLGEVFILQEPYARVDYYDPAVPSQKRYSWYKGFVTGTQMPYFLSGNASTTFADNTALGKYYSSARQVMSAFQGMTFLGELAETIHLIKNPTKQLFASTNAYVNAVRKLFSSSRGKSLAKLNKDVASLYLEYVYGWLPLVNDIGDAATAYNRILGQKVLLRCRGFGEESKQVLNVAGQENPSTSNLTSKYSEIGTTTVQVSYYGAVRGTAVGSKLPDIVTNQLGFRLDEFVPTVWELIPYSFLIDYFTNIGDIISASTYVNANLAWTSKTVRTVYEVQRSSVVDTFATKPPYIGSGGGGYSWRTTRTTVSRTANIAPRIPSFQFELPGSDTKWLNVAALIAQSRNAFKLISSL
jgi:hypothetical protein